MLNLKFFCSPPEKVVQSQSPIQELNGVGKLDGQYRQFILRDGDVSEKSCPSFVRILIQCWNKTVCVFVEARSYGR